MLGLWRKGYFVTYGMSNFTNKGFKKANNDMAELHQADLHGRAFLVTGANSGIGYATAKYFASRGGARVRMLHPIGKCRAAGGLWLGLCLGFGN